MTQPNWYCITNRLYTLRREMMQQLEKGKPVDGVEVLAELERARVEALLVVVASERAK